MGEIFLIEWTADKIARDDKDFRSFGIWTYCRDSFLRLRIRFKVYIYLFEQIRNFSSYLSFDKAFFAFL